AELRSFTITPQLLIGNYGTLRAEYRLDMANHRVFQKQYGIHNGQAQKKTQETVSVQYIVAF
ncbi:hypothetical protein HOG00_01695, partial [bacterium]|nr:hypothetical protein [bacterium]